MRTFVRVNHQIRVPQVRCVDSDGRQIGVISTREALTRAMEQGLDLVEVAANAQPPVCRIVDYGKYKYEVEKKEKQARKHQSVTRIKEVKFHSNVDEHDYQTKLRHIREFLEEGHRVKVSLMFRGRESAHQDLGFKLMERVMKDTEPYGVSERAPNKLGRMLLMLLTPKPSSVKAKSAKPATG